MKCWPGIIALLCAASAAWGSSVFESFEDGKLGGFPSWDIQDLRASEAKASIDRVDGESWLRLQCGFGGSLTEGTAVGVIAQDVPGEELDVTSRVRLQEGFLASVNLRCDPVHLSGYAGGVSREDRLYVVRMHQGRTKVLAKADLPKPLKGTHTDCWIRFKAERYQLMLKVWPHGQDEPEEWQVETEDRRFRSGLAGLSVSCYSPIVGGQPTAEACFDQVRIVQPPSTSALTRTAEPQTLGR